MTRVVLCLALVTCMVSAVTAQGVDIDDLHIRALADQLKQKPDSRSQLWAQVPSVTPTEISALLDRISEVLSAKPDSQSVDSLSAISREIGRQTSAFKKALEEALPSRETKVDDVDLLFSQVFENKSHVDPDVLKALTTTYETLYVQFGQYMNSRFLATNRSGISSYRSADQEKNDAAKVADAAAQHLAAYQANIIRATKDLRLLTGVETARQ